MSKGGESKSVSKTELPPWYSDYAKRALQLSNSVAQKGYTPYMGPDVAAFNPQQMAGMQSANDWSAAFGGQGAQPQQVAASIPKPQQFAGGIQGYSSYPGFQEVMKKFKQERPGQYKYIQSFAIDPVTGKIAPQYKKLANVASNTKPGGSQPIPPPGNNQQGVQPTFTRPGFIRNEH